MHRRNWLLLMTSMAALHTPAASAVDSIWAYPGVTGRLIYAPDAQGDRVLDFSSVGYRGRGAELIPDVPTVVTVQPIAGDDTAHIQAAIDQVAAMPLGSDGIRGAVQLAAGHYDVSGQLNIAASGIVLRGAGRDDGGTVLHARSTTRGSVLINVAGTGSQSLTGSTRNMIDKVVPVGATSFRVNSVAGFAVGDTVRIERPSTAQWIDELGMNEIPPRDDGGEVVQWQPGAVNIRYDRVITRIEGNRIFVDAPLANALEQQYGGGTIRRYTWNGRIENVGIENLRAESDFTSATDENHAWDFVSIDRAQHVWVRNTTSAHFAGSAVVSNPGAKWVTVENAINLDPKSRITGERRYTFDLSGQLELVTGSEANQGRHDFVNNSTRPPGPHVFHRSVAHDALDESGPHQRWATGSLFDNIVVEGDQINLRNRGNFGTGHGWAGANMVIWNSSAESFIVQNPPTAQNWLIGSAGAIVNDTTFGPQPPGYVDSHGTRVAVDSLYEAQLADSADLVEFHLNASGGPWNDPASWREGLVPAVYAVETRDYLVGDIDDFVYDGPASVDGAAIAPAWQAELASLGAGPLTGFDDTAIGGSAAFTIDHQLDGDERVIHASLALALKLTGDSSGADYLRLFNGDPQHRLAFADLGWQTPLETGQTLVGVLDLGGQLNQLQSGQLNVQVADTGVDWALYTAIVARPLVDSRRATAFVDNGGTVELTAPVATIGSIVVGDDGGGSLRVGSEGLFQLSENYVQYAGGTLAMEIGGRIVVAGDAVLDGALQINLGAATTLAAGQQFTLLEANSISGEFGSIELPPPLPGLAWSLDATSTALRLGIHWAADFNHDGAVDGNDLADWRTNYGRTSTALHQHGDADADGDVDGADYLVWQRQLGLHNVSLQAVPEPRDLMAFVGATGVLLCSRRRTQRQENQLKDELR